MDRRLVGALLVAAVVITAIILPVTSGRRIAGEAIPTRLPADPVVGQCLVERTVEPDATGQLVPLRPSSAAGTASIKPTPQQVVVVACHGQPILGEIVAISTIDQAPETASGPDCRTAALEYAGLVARDHRFDVPDQPNADPVTWSFSIDLRTYWVLPTPVMRAAGRNWVACVAAPSHAGSYQGRILTAYSGGSLPTEFGTCWNTRQITASARAIDCGQPHQSELISVGVLRDHASASPEGIQRSCEQLAARVLRRADPTASGALAVATAPNSVDLPHRLTASLNVVCYVVTAHRSLAGTLVGLDDRPVPFAG